MVYRITQYQFPSETQGPDVKFWKFIFYLMNKLVLATLPFSIFLSLGKFTNPLTKTAEKEVYPRGSTPVLPVHSLAYKLPF